MRYGRKRQVYMLYCGGFFGLFVPITMTIFTYSRIEIHFKASYAVLGLVCVLCSSTSRSGYILSLG